jgi:Tfp pilus assembly protein PilF
VTDRNNAAVERFAQALDAMQRGDWLRAQSLAESLLAVAPRAAGPHFIAGVAALQLNQLQRALSRLGRAAQLDSTRGDCLAQYARALAIAGDLPQAAAVARRAMQPPAVADASALDTVGIVLGRAALHEEAATAFARAVERDPRHAGYRYNLATSLLFHGDIDGAEREYETCLQLDPRYWRADLSIAQLRPQAAHRNHVARLRQRVVAHSAEPEARLYLNLALAKELEDLDDTVGALAHYTAGKSVLAHRAHHLVDVAARCVDALVDRGPPEPANDGDPSAEPIFIVGMPRTGTTLVDRIVSGHEAVHSAGELDNFALQLRRLSGQHPRTLLETALALPPEPDGWEALGRGYVASTRPATGHTPRFTDKHPLNFLFLGHIARALPNARLICLRRNPMDTCLSNFRQLFATEATDYDYAFDLLACGRYYLLFDRLMRHWHEAMPGRILDLQYEALVEAPEPTVRGVLAFCGLPWQPDCLQFERNAAVVTTASAAQVRSPLNRASLDRWRRYGPALQPLRDLLAAGGIDPG